MLQSWILYGLGSGICFASMAMIFRHVINSGVSPFVINMLSFGIGFLMLFLLTIAKGGTKIPDTKLLLFIALGALLLIIGNYLYFSAIGLAPNPGFATALKTTDILFATFLGWMIFRGELSILQIFGVFMIVGGVFLVAKK